MKYEDLKDLKTGDKVIVEVAEIDKATHCWTVKLDGMGIDGWIENEAVIAVYHEPVKIKMTAEEKREFDKLKKVHKSLFLAFIDIDDKEYHNLYDHLFRDIDEEHCKAQIEFTKAWENPDLIEVEKEKKYYVHLLEDALSGYLNYNTSTKEYCTGNKREFGSYKAKFTESEIAKMHFSNFKFTDKALEEVEDE